MLTLYGLPALLVADPDGTEVAYLFLTADPPPGYSRAWALTKPDGTRRTVSERDGKLRCSCEDWYYRGRFRTPARCKHTDSIAAHLEEQESEHGPYSDETAPGGRPGIGLSRCG